MKDPTRNGVFQEVQRAIRDELQRVDDVREDVADRGPEQGENDDHDNGDEDEDERVLNQALTFFTRHVQHCGFSMRVELNDT